MLIFPTCPDILTLTKFSFLTSVGGSASFRARNAMTRFWLKKLNYQLSIVNYQLKTEFFLIFATSIRFLLGFYLQHKDK